MLGPTPAGKKVWQRLQGHALPLRNLDGMDPIVCGKLIDRPFPTDRLESHFRLERTTVLPSLCRHLLVLPHGSMSLTYSVVQFLGSIIPHADVQLRWNLHRIIIPVGPWVAAVRAREVKDINPVRIPSAASMTYFTMQAVWRAERTAVF